MAFPLLRTAESPNVSIRRRPVYWPDTSDQNLEPPVSSKRLRAIQLFAVVTSLIGLAYLIWRAIATVPGATWWLAWPLLLLELHSFLTFLLYCHVLWHPGSVAAPEPRSSSSLSVSVLIPTYNEPYEVLLPTVAAAAALPEATDVWVLDDGGRAWVRELAAELGASYVTRATREHAKAGNINAALSRLDTDLVAVLDADHVVRSDFLTNVLGYFDDSNLALVQTPQSFYNTDSFEHMRTLRGKTYCEQDLFYRLLAEARNHWDAAFWCGTNSVVRLSALLEVGGVATETVTEDIHTTIRLHRHGYRTVYHNEVLARGLAAANSQQYLNQRLRWGTGAMEVLRLEKPLRSRALTWHQRLSYASTLLGWFDGWRTLGLILVPLVTVLTGAVPAKASLVTFAFFFGAAWVTQSIATDILGRGRTAWLPATIFSFIRMPAMISATLTYLNRWRRATFHVTEKGRSSEQRQRMAPPWSLVALLVASAASLCWYAASTVGLTVTSYSVPWVANAAAIWIFVNAGFLTAALVRITARRFGSERRAAVRFAVQGSVSVDGVRVHMSDMSLTGARLVTRAPLEPGSRVQANWAPLAGEILEALVRTVRPVKDGWAAGIEFVDLTLQKRAHLALHLFETGLAPRLDVCTDSSGSYPEADPLQDSVHLAPSVVANDPSSTRVPSS